MANSTRTTVILRGPENWVDWIEQIRNRALNSQIWEYVDPSTPDDKAPTLTKPEYPAIDTIIPDASTREPSWYEKRRLDQLEEQYRIDIKEYWNADKALKELNQYIQDTVGLHLLPRIRQNSGARDRLKRLRSHCAPAPYDRQVVQLRVNKVKEGPSSRNLDRWLQDFETVMYEAREVGLSDADNHKAILTFFALVDNYFPSAVEGWERDLSKLPEEQWPSLHEIIIDFNRLRNFRKARTSVADALPNKSPRSRDASFPTLGGKDENGRTRDRNQTANNDKFQIPPCLCRERHFYTKCPYLNPHRAPPGFRRDRRIAEDINRRLARDPKKREQVAKAQQKALRETSNASAQPATATASEPDDDTPLQVHAATFSTPDTSNYSLRRSFILDTGSNVHVCNDRSRFQDFTLSQDTLYAGDSRPTILGRDKVTIEAKSPSGKTKKITLSEVLFIPSFHTNVGSAARLNQSDVWFDNMTDTLKLGRTNPRTICLLERRHQQWVIEYNPVTETSHSSHSSQDGDNSSSFQSSRTPKTLSGTIYQWHVRMGHIGLEPLKRLVSASEGIRVVIGGPDISTCETCKFIRADQQISRVPMPRGTRPFEKIHLDLINLNEGIDGSTWVLHLICDFTAFVIAEPLFSKRLARDKLLAILEYIRRQYGQEVRIIRGDNETSLEPLLPFLRSSGYVFETSSPRTPAQNGIAERSGGVITTRMRALRIDSGLPENLWPHFLKHAVHIVNRTPIESLNWKSPFQFLQETLGRMPTRPYLGNLYAVGSAAYARIANLPRKDKLDPRATKEYLIGVDASNIFLIWDPDTNDVSRHRDVRFDESQRFTGKRPWITQLVRTYVPPPPELRPQEPDEDSSDDEFLRPRLRNGSPPSALPDPPRDPADRSHEDAYGLSPDDILQQDLQDVLSHDPPPDSSTYAPPGAWLTPEPTPELGPPTPKPASQHKQVRFANTKSTNNAPRRDEISADFDPSNILSSKRRPKPTAGNAQFASFMVGTLHKNRLHRSELPPVPENYYEARRHKFWPEWKQAMDVEFDELVQRQVFRVITRPAGARVIALRWVFAYKFDEDGFLIKFKARLCVRGDQQLDNFLDARAATLALRSLRAIMSITAFFDLDMEQSDVVNAFVNSRLDELVYCEMPPGFARQGFCLFLLMALYGLHRSPLLWFKDFGAELHKHGLSPVSDDACVYSNGRVIVLFYVDDVLWLSRRSDAAERNAIRNKLEQTFVFRFMGDARTFLGIRIVRDRTARKLWLCQDAYIDKLADHFHLGGVRPPLIPMTKPPAPFDGQASPGQIKEYQQKLGSLMYAAVATRPDVAYAASVLSRHAVNPSREHLDAVDCVLRYLDNTRFFALAKGFLFTLFGGSIDWRSGKQHTVSTSTMEAELLVMGAAGRQLVAWKRFFHCIDFDPEQLYSIAGDNRQTLRLLVADTPQLQTKIRHVDINHFWLREKVQDGDIHVFWTPSADLVRSYQH